MPKLKAYDGNKFRHVFRAYSTDFFCKLPVAIYCYLIGEMDKLHFFQSIITRFIDKLDYLDI